MGTFARETWDDLVSFDDDATDVISLNTDYGDIIMASKTINGGLLIEAFKKLLINSPASKALELIESLTPQ